MCDLILINPPHPYLVNAHAQTPMGLLYLAASAERAGLLVRIVNMTACRDVRAAVDSLPSARCVGITGTSLDVDAVNAVAYAVRARRPQSRIAVGGPISLSRYQLDTDAIDVVVHGEGEDRITDIVAGRVSGFVKASPVDVQTLPRPARHLWPGPFGQTVFIGGREYFPGGSTTLVTSRGCPHRCGFCAGPALPSHKPRLRRPEQVIDEMERCVTDYGVRQFRLSDEFFTARPAHAHAICDRIRRSDILGNGKGIAWRASVGVRPHMQALFTALAGAGCKELAFGVESADPDVLDRICRKGGPQDARQALINARRAGLRTKALMMVGLPGTTPDTARIDQEFIWSGIADAVAVTVFTPLPGCDIAAHPDRYGCRVLPDRARASLCMYGPDGPNAIEPTVQMDTIQDDVLLSGMAATVAAAEAALKIGKG